MNGLLEKFNDYMKINNYILKYELENGAIVEFKFKQTDFPHLIGLHKLRDIPVIRQFNDKNNKTVSAKFIISKIKNQLLLTEESIQHSSYFGEIEERYIKFTSENLLSITYTDIVIEFDPTIIGSSLKAKYILIDEKPDGYNHLCIAEDKDSCKYAESFFFNPTDRYIYNQQKVKINKVQIFDAGHKLYLEESFNANK